MQHLDEGTIHAWLDGALDAAESARVEAHAAACAECSARVAEARGLIAAASRILIALDDVPGGVIPAQAPDAASHAASDAAAPPAPPVQPDDVRPLPLRAPARRAIPGVGSWRWRVAAAAAAVVLVAGTSIVTLNRAAPDDARSVMVSAMSVDTGAAAATTAAALSEVSTALAVPEKTSAPAAQSQIQTEADVRRSVPAAAPARTLPGGIPAERLADASTRQAAGRGRVSGGIGGIGAGAAAQGRGVAAGAARPAAPPPTITASAASGGADGRRDAPATPPALAEAPRAAVGAVTGAAAGAAVGNAVAARDEALGAQPEARRKTAAAASDSVRGYATSAPVAPPAPPATLTRRDSQAAAEAAAATAALRAEREVPPGASARRRAFAAPGAPAPDVIGCYALTLGPWSPAPRTASDTAGVAPPSRVHLAADPAPRAPGSTVAAFVARAVGATAAARLGSWRDIPGDSVEIVWPGPSSAAGAATTGGVTIRVHLGREGGVPRGQARATATTSRPELRATVIARKLAACVP